MILKSSFSHRNKEPESGVLYIVGTPIGNLNDISLRALNILKKVSVIACEDTRETKKILNKFEIRNNLISFNQHNSKKKIDTIISYLDEGKALALVSDAGLPGISDPGEDLIYILKKKGYETICIPGPSAVTTALVSSGFPSSKFIFEGFLPKKKIEREQILFEISKSKKTTILFESPHRLIKLLKELENYCGGSREILVTKELTKRFEEHIGPNINAALNFFENKKILGEFTIVIKGIDKNIKSELNKLELQQELNELISAGLSYSSASKYLAHKNKISKNFIYNVHNDKKE